MNLAGYYKGYLKLHQDPRNRALHTVGILATIGWVVAAAVTGQWWWLLGAPFVAYPFAWTGHFVFEHNHPAAFKHPFKAKLCDWWMFWDTLRGRLAPKDPWEGHTKSSEPCAKCGGVVYMREINDYPDTAITCSECHAYYVVDGPDS